jgi:hypothetical protein
MRPLGAILAYTVMKKEGCPALKYPEIFNFQLEWYNNYSFKTNGS